MNAAELFDNFWRGVNVMILQTIFAQKHIGGRELCRFCLITNSAFSLAKNLS
jgi:hypothetical protein